MTADVLPGEPLAREDAKNPSQLSGLLPVRGPAIGLKAKIL